MTDTIAADPRELVAQLLALTLGQSGDASRVRDWTAMHELAVQQRCAALMWLRSGDAIRKHAPAAVTSQWRSMALSVGAEGSALLSALGETQKLLADAGVESVVLKGPTLSLALYGPPIARPTHDLDLFIPKRQRDLARGVLMGAGWRQSEWDARSGFEVLNREAAGTRIFLDLFSSVPKHLATSDAPLPSCAERVVEGVPVRMHWGEGLATYLSVHLAKHEFAPMLWYVDIATLWGSLSPEAKVAERRYADRIALGRYLEWAVQRADALSAAARGDAEALRLLGITGAGRVQSRRWLREISLAANARGRLMAVLRWVFPTNIRTVPGFLRLVLWRIRHLSRYGVERVPIGTVGSADRSRVRREVDDGR